MGVRTVTREGSEGRPKGTVPAPSLFIVCLARSCAGRPMPDSFTRHPPDSMLRPPSRFTDSSAPAETQPAASGRCGRRVVVAVPVLARSCFGSTRLFRQQGWCSLMVDPSGTGFPFASLLSLSAASARNEQKRGSEPVRLGNDGSHRRRFLILFVVPFRTAFPSFPIYLSVRPITEWRERDTVLSMFRWDGFRVGLSERIAGKCAALAGFREGGRLGKPMPRFSPFANILFSDRQNNVRKGYIQFKSRPSDRRHAYF